MTKPPVRERGALHAVGPYIDAAPVDRRASAVGRVGAAHIGDGSRVSASRCLDGRLLAVASHCEGREPGERGRQRSNSGENAGAAPGLNCRRNDVRSALAHYNGSIGRRDYPDRVVVRWMDYWKGADDLGRRASL